MARREYSGKVVVITGAAGGLGRALAKRYAQAGARLALLDLHLDDLGPLVNELNDAGVSNLAVDCDVTDEQACRRALKIVDERFGKVDVLINNAGITHRSAFAETDCAVMRKVVEVNLFGSMHCTKHALEKLIAGRGQIIVISSVAGLGPLDGRAGYAASKHALHGMFETLRSELRGQGVAVSIICPTFIATGIGAAALGCNGQPAPQSQATVGRVASAKEIADEVFLAGSKEQRLLIPSLTGRLAHRVQQLFPALYERIMSHSVKAEFEG